MLKEDLIVFVNEFNSAASVPKAVTTSFFALISKTDNLVSLDDYISICLIGSFLEC